jgi:bacterioferritin
MAQQNNLASVAEIRERARKHLELGAVTDEYKADRVEVIRILNELLATELTCVLRYKSHYYTACGIHSDAVKPEFLQHAQEAEQHADLLAKRIIELNGAPDFNPAGLAQRSRSEFAQPRGLVDMIRDDLVAERIAVESYAEVARWLGSDDPTTRKLMLDILAVEEEHAMDMKRLIAQLLQTAEKRK